MTVTAGGIYTPVSCLWLTSEYGRARKTRSPGSLRLGPRIHSNGLTVRIEVDGRGLEVALKSWQKIASENRGTLQRHRYHVGPAEARRLKDRKARKRKRRARSNRLARAA